MFVVGRREFSYFILRLLYFAMSEDTWSTSGLRSIEPVNVIAAMAKRLRITSTSLARLMNQDQLKCNRWEAMMADQLLEQLLEGELILDSYETLSIDENGPSEKEWPEDSDNDDEEPETTKTHFGSRKSQPDPEYSPENERKKRVCRNEVPESKWENAWRYFTKQTDKSKPLDLSDEYLNKIKTVPTEVMHRRREFVGYNCENLKKWREDKLKGNGTYSELDKLVYEQFQEARSKLQRVNDRLLRQWAVKLKNERFPNLRFKASESWVRNFKHRHSIVSRTITHKVGRDYWKKQDNLANSADNFVAEVRQIIEEEGYSPEEVFNFDQTRFDKEPHSHRTHAIRGDAQVKAVVGSINATTHSYCVMPLISMAGDVLEPLYLLSQEAGGHWPKTKQPKQPTNLAAYPGTSSNMNKQHLETYLEQVFFPGVIGKGVTKCLLLCDSWSVNKDKALFDKVAKKFPQLKVKRLLIPEGTTGQIQPLDVGYFRHYKSFARSITDSLEVENKLGQRQHYINLQALLHHQFRAARFRPLIQRAFVKSGYTDERIGEYEQVPAKYCLDFQEISTCGEGMCNNISTFRCAHCQNTFCFDHAFITKVHLC